MYFDKSKTHEGSRTGCVFIDPLQRKHLISSCLEFRCTNNTTEYEILILGLQKSIDLKFFVLKVVSVSEILVCHVRNSIHCVSPRLKSYQQEVWKIISHFQDFNIILVLRMRHVITNALENVAARMLLLRHNFSIAILYKPYVPDNITNLCVFYDDQ